MNEVNELIGRIISRIDVNRNDGDDRIVFYLNDGDRYEMYHSQDCCESVNIEDIEGDVDDLTGTPIITAEESSNRGDGDDDYYGDSETWTYYKFSTILGYVTIRWYGTSNGYYSESVNFDKID